MEVPGRQRPSSNKDHNRYGVERAGDLLGLQYMGKHSWYREGAEYLIGAQKKDGSWAAAKGDPNRATKRR